MAHCRRTGLNMREVILDCETTGLDPSNGDRIIELACVELVNRIPTGRTFHTYVGLERTVSAATTRITGITNDILADKFSHADVVDRLMDFLREDPIVAHNAAFERAFLNAELTRLGRDALPSERFIDTLALAREHSPASSATLDSVCKRLKISIEDRESQGALEDARLVSQVYVALLGLIRPEATTKQERDQVWWNAWWAKDFSWDGLKKKAWRGWMVLPDLSVVEAPASNDLTPTGARPATLQDYWRDQEGDLIGSPDGLHRFTRVHLPLTWRDGKPTGKADWVEDSLDPILCVKLQALQNNASEDGWRERSLLGASRCAQFQGAVLLREISSPQEQPSPLFLRLDSAIFSRNAYFDGETFSGETSFVDAAFQGGARFSGATFSGDAIFDGATFSGDADFRRATFSRSARFKTTAVLRNAYFDYVIFLGDAIFDGAAFSGYARFSGGKNADGTTASFQEATFGRGFSCSTREFHGLVYFNRSKFLGRMDLGAAVFDKLASFEAIIWPALPRDWHKAFNGTLFRAAPDFSRSGFGALAAFDGAVLERGVAFDDAKPTFADRIYLIERHGALAAAAADFADIIENQEEERNETRIEEAGRIGKPKHTKTQALKRSDLRDRRLAELERGCRVLKQAMEKASNKSREQHFYRYELKARRAQAATPLSEQIFSYLYDWFGNYGASIGRPFMAVTGLTLLFSAVYWGLDIGWADAASHAVALDPTANVDPALERALSFSASRIFPFGAFDDVSAGWLQSYETAHGSLAALGVRILASLQSTFALTLVFMVGLAVRRKFQIS
jgi:DNA polymerase III subunit epsilon